MHQAIGTHDRWVGIIPVWHVPVDLMGTAVRLPGVRDSNQYRDYLDYLEYLEYVSRSQTHTTTSFAFTR